jgi:hypothetical protein
MPELFWAIRLGSSERRRQHKRSLSRPGAESIMQLWFFVLLAVVVLVAVLLAISMAYRGRSSAAGQNTTIIERNSPADRDTTVVEHD